MKTSFAISRSVTYCLWSSELYRGPVSLVISNGLMVIGNLWLTHSRRSIAYVQERLKTPLVCYYVEQPDGQAVRRKLTIYQPRLAHINNHGLTGHRYNRRSLWKKVINHTKKKKGLVHTTHLRVNVITTNLHFHLKLKRSANLFLSSPKSKPQEETPNSS